MSKTALVLSLIICISCSKPSEKQEEQEEISKYKFEIKNDQIFYQPEEKSEINKLAAIDTCIKINKTDLKTDKDLKDYYEVELENLCNKTITTIAIGTVNSPKKLDVQIKPRGKQQVKVYPEYKSNFEKHISFLSIYKIRFDDGTFIER